MEQFSAIIQSPAMTGVSPRSMVRAASALRPLQIGDEARFREAIDRARPTSWLYFFPFLFCYSQRDSMTLLWEEIDDSICVYLRRKTKHRTTLALYLPPFPFSAAALQTARRRVADFNGSDGLRIVWAEEEFRAGLTAAGFALTPREEEYVYDTSAVTDAAGGAYGRLRQHLNRARKLPGLSIDPFAADDRKACIALLDAWYDHLSEQKGVDVYGYSYVLACIRHAGDFAPGSLQGLVTRQHGRVVGVTFGGPIHAAMGSLFVCIADHGIEGLGYLQRHAFISRFSEVPLYNDSSDTGRSGLAHVKQQFRPVRMNAIHEARDG